MSHKIYFIPHNAPRHHLQLIGSQFSEAFPLLSVREPLCSAPKILHPPPSPTRLIMTLALATSLLKRGLNHNDTESLPNQKLCYHIKLEHGFFFSCMVVF